MFKRLHIFVHIVLNLYKTFLPTGFETIQINSDFFFLFFLGEGKNRDLVEEELKSFVIKFLYFHEQSHYVTYNIKNKNQLIF